ncbi:SGNH/GDSL hydrolase family protein, partial [Isoptericola sp. NPDC057191]|uniref:SGNH/GDSL hydrolase family protein n=1 Tax=Isoptericola sp. NPDC057191 TaxID=3346041 RepID=UPI00363D0EB2
SGTVTGTVTGTATDTAGPATDQVVSWGASPDVLPGSLDDQTVRNLVHTSVGGPGVRVELSNAFGTAPVTFDSVYVGVRDAGADVVPGSNRRATFGGADAVTVAPGAHVLSDPVDWNVPPDTTVAVSVHAVGQQTTPTGHLRAFQTSFVAAGDAAHDEDGTPFTTTTDHWYWVSGLVVDAPRAVDTLAVLGDSITDGRGSTVGADHRWPDYLADQVSQAPVGERYGVMNQGIGANRVLSNATSLGALARFDRDVLAKPDVETVIVLEGINDIGNGDATSADQLVAAYRQLLARAHAVGVCVVGGTLTPFEGAFYYDATKEAVRADVNQWIRTTDELDGVVDFDAAVRDPAAPRRLLPQHDSGDHLHPGDAGYAAMAAAVDPEVLRCHR